LKCDKLKGCVCKAGWNGTTCSENINECDGKSFESLSYKQMFLKFFLQRLSHIIIVNVLIHQEAFTLFAMLVTKGELKMITIAIVRN
jgi:hypothetical protein